MPITLPPLPHHQGSWAIVRRSTGECVMELFRGDAHLAQRMNGEAYFARPIGAHLAMINHETKEGQALSADAHPTAA